MFNPNHQDIYNCKFYLPNKKLKKNIYYNNINNNIKLNLFTVPSHITRPNQNFVTFTPY